MTQKVGYGPQGGGPDNVNLTSSTTAELQAPDIVRQHHISMLLNGGLGLHGLTAFSGGLFPGMNSGLVGVSHLDTGLHALLMARRLNGSAGRFSGLEPLSASSSDLPTLALHQPETQSVHGSADDEHKRLQVHQNISVTNLGGDKNDDTLSIKAQTGDTKKRKP